MMFKVGEFIFCEFKLQEINEMEGERVTSVHDGWFEMGSRDLSDRCFPLTIRNKVISETFQGFSDKIHAINNAGLNYPDIARYFVLKWVECCNGASDDKIKLIYDEVQNFINTVKEKSNHEVIVNGVSVFRN
jgi:hypothetical protein